MLNESPSGRAASERAGAQEGAYLKDAAAAVQNVVWYIYNKGHHGARAPFISVIIVNHFLFSPSSFLFFFWMGELQ